MSTTSSRNFTTLYSGSGSVVPQGAYGNANVVSLLNVGTDGGNTVSNIVATGNITTTSQISAQGNITTAGFFVGSLVGNVSGNVTAAGSNTQVQFNNNGVLGADGDFTYNNSTNALAVTGNITGGNLLTGGAITATGNVTAANFFGNIVGNVDAAGANTQVQFNNNGVLDADSDFTFDSATTTLSVSGNINGNIINGTSFVNPNASGNLYITNQSGSNGNANLFITTTQSNSQIRLEPGTDANGKVVIGGNTNVPADVTLQGAYRKRLIITTNENYGGILINPNIKLDDPKINPTRPSIEINPTNDGAAVVTGNLFVQRQAGGGGGLVITEQLSVVGNVGVGQAGNLVALGNITGANILTGGFVSAVGNVTGNYFIGNGSQLTGLPATYGNANVVSLLSAFGSNVISTTGNITASNFIGNVIGNLLGNVAAAGSNTQIQFNTGNLLDASANLTFDKSTSTLKVTGNTTYPTAGVEITKSSIVGNVLFGNLVITNQFQASSRGPVVVDTNLLVVGQDNAGLGTNASITAIRNQTLELTTTNAGAPAVYVGKYVSGDPSFTGNVDVRSSNVGGYGGTGNINLTGNVYVGRNAQGADTANALANLIVTDSVYVAGQISSVGNITANAGSFFIGNGSQLTGIVTSSYGNANVADFLGNGFGSNTITTTGNITAGYFIGNGAALTSLTGANVVGTVANATYALNANASTFAGTVTTNAQPNITSVGILTAVNTSGNISATGNVTGANINSAVFQAVNSAGGALRNSGGTTQASWGAGGGDNFAINVSTNISGANAQIDISPTGNSGHVHIKPTGTPSVEIAPTFTGSINNMIIGNVTPAAVNATTVSASGNVTGNYFIGNGSQLTGLPATYGNANVADFLANGFGSNVILTTGNINGGNLVAAANLTSTQQTVVGTANVGTTGNIVVSGRNLATDMAFNPDGATGNALYTGRVMVGTGWAGNISVGQPSRLSTMDMINRGNTTASVRQFESDSIVNLTANVSNPSFRQQAMGSRLRIGGGPAGNSTAFGGITGAPFTLSTAQLNMDIGNVSPYFLGNTSVSHAALNTGSMTLNAGSSIGNAYGYVPFLQSGGSGGTSNVTNYIGIASSFGGANVTGNMFCFYNGNTTSVGAYALQTTNTVRAADNYYFLRNDDAVAQTQLGSLRSYNEFRYDTATTGNITLDKNNAQVQYIAPTANVTIDAYANMVTTLSDSVNTDQEIDTLTVLVQQGATPYTVTLPTGATYQYAGNISTVPAVANARTILTVVAANVAGTVNYFTTVQSDQATASAVAGANTQIQFNDAGVFGATAGLTFDKTSNAMVAVGNITGGNIATGNLTIAPNVGQLGNVIINTNQPYVVQANNTITTNQPGRIVVGNGWDGDYSSLYDPQNRARLAKFSVWEKVDRTDTAGAGSTALVTNLHQQRFMNGNVTTGSTRNFSVTNIFNVGGGPAANVSTATSPAAFVAMNGSLVVGNVSPTIGGSPSSANVGDTTLASGAAALFLIQSMANSTMTTAYGVVSAILPGGSEARIGNVINYANWNVNNATGIANVTPNFFASYYHANANGIAGGGQGAATFDAYRSSPNYYAFYNADTAAQAQLGSLRSYNEYQHTANTSGTVAIDKNNGQVQYIAPTANVTIGDFQNFVFNANNGNANVSVANIAQVDTVTLIIQQGATPYTVTMPTGNAQIKYASGNSTVSSTANAATMVSVTATKVGNATTSGTGLYLVTVSPGFV